MSERESFSSSLTAVLAMAGSAIGLGNIWRFPYMVGQNGGAAYILVYLVCCLSLSLPIFFAESIIGRRSGKGNGVALESLAPQGGKKWGLASIPTVVAPLLLLSFYSVVGGWSVRYFGVSVFEGFASSSPGDFTAFSAGRWMPVVFHTIFLLACAVIVSRGVKSGIEAFNRITMPLLFVLVVMVMVFSLRLPGSASGIEYLLRPDFSKLSASGIADAMGQSFFSLSLGVGTILTYSSYMKKSENLVLSGVGTAFFDLIFALMAGFAIMPAVFAAGIEPGAGPGLIFETIPYIFSQMSSGSLVIARIASIIFFLSILISALTSAISMLEVGVAYLVEKRNVSRKRAVIILVSGIWTVGVFCAWSSDLFNTLDMLTSDYLMAFGGLLFTIFVGWVLKKEDVRDEVCSGGLLKFPSWLFETIWFSIRYVAPVTILAIFVTNLIF